MDYIISLKVFYFTKKHFFPSNLVEIIVFNGKENYLRFRSNVFSIPYLF